MVHSFQECCPKCGGELVFRGGYKRLVRGENGTKESVYIYRMSCKNCKAKHSVIPDNLIPYKRYSKTIIEGFQKGEYSNDDLRFESYPCELMVKKWQSQ